MSSSTHAPTTAGESSTKHPPPATRQPDDIRHRGMDPNSAVVSHATRADVRRQEMREDLDVVLSHGSHPHHKPLKKSDEETWVSGGKGKEHLQTVQVEAGRPPNVGHVPALDQKTLETTTQAHSESSTE